MRGPLDYDDIEELEHTARSRDAHVEAAATLWEWAQQTHPDDGRVSPADLLVAAANHLKWAGDRQAAMTRLREAVAAEGNAAPDTRCYLHGALLEAGRREEAEQLAREVQRSRPTGSDVYTFMG